MFNLVENQELSESERRAKNAMLLQVLEQKIQHKALCRMRFDVTFLLLLSTRSTLGLQVSLHLMM